MQNFTQKFVGMMKSENIFQWQGGTIIVSQIENEFRHLERDQGAPAKAYAGWAEKMKLDLDTGIQWIMCKEDDAPDPIINTWNGLCDRGFHQKCLNPPLLSEDSKVKTSKILRSFDVSDIS
ncbi:uncharacterized protein A4U43_UnF2120 [Asparagus officinalis]|uniref:beta-galactosidase n=1 Tax=Asparagus officinalis TaxID=4686 RepID=A0A1R3L7D7_ASPOF|nr:beta-galactosidase 2-like [Asparagus officinalis]XP_020249782.1 beta-galactosidase 2-like [Asparagus officinalis]ONK55510.1 uncharacterized protein A4U43_UnF2120 [Asparagus officinalis]